MVMPGRRWKNPPPEVQWDGLRVPSRGPRRRNARRRPWEETPPTRLTSAKKRCLRAGRPIGFQGRRKRTCRYSNQFLKGRQHYLRRTGGLCGAEEVRREMAQRGRSDYLESSDMVSMKAAKPPRSNRMQEEIHTPARAILRPDSLPSECLMCHKATMPKTNAVHWGTSMHGTIENTRLERKRARAWPWPRRRAAAVRRRNNCRRRRRARSGPPRPGACPRKVQHHQQNQAPKGRQCRHWLHPENRSRIVLGSSISARLPVTLVRRRTTAPSMAAARKTQHSQRPFRQRNTSGNPERKQTVPMPVYSQMMPQSTPDAARPGANPLELRLLASPGAS